MPKALGHGSSEHRVVFQTDQKFVACTTCRDVSRNFYCYHSELNSFRAMVGAAKENESESGGADCGVLWVFVCIKESLEQSGEHSKVQRDARGN